MLGKSVFQTSPEADGQQEAFTVHISQTGVLGLYGYILY